MSSRSHFYFVVAVDYSVDTVDCEKGNVLYKHRHNHYYRNDCNTAPAKLLPIIVKTLYNQLREAAKCEFDKNLNSKTVFL